MCREHTRTHNGGGWLLVSISVILFAEFGQGGSQVLIVRSLMLRRSEGGKVR